MKRPDSSLRGRELIVVFWVSAFLGVGYTHRAFADLCADSLVPFFATMNRALPVVRQNCNGKCGPSSLAIALAYFGRILQKNPVNPFELSDEVSNVVYAATTAPTQVLVDHPLAYGIRLNNSEALAAVARMYGLHAKVDMLTLEQVAAAINSKSLGREEVVLVHWWMGPEAYDFHWSVFQSLSAVHVHLRDPWPTSPVDHLYSSAEFRLRSGMSVPGKFHVVRIATSPIL